MRDLIGKDARIVENRLNLFARRFDIPDNSADFAADLFIGQHSERSLFVVDLLDDILRQIADVFHHLGDILAAGVHVRNELLTVIRKNLREVLNVVETPVELVECGV